RGVVVSEGHRPFCHPTRTRDQNGRAGPAGRRVVCARGPGERSRINGGRAGASGSCTNPMEFRKVLALRGPNIWARFPVLEAWVDPGAATGVTSAAGDDLGERLAGRLAEAGPRPEVDERLRAGTTPAHVLGRACLELQALAGS